MDESCVFCKIVGGSEPAIVVSQGDSWIAFMDRFPVARGHILIIPKKHYEVLMDMPLDEAGQLFAAVARLSRAVERASRADGLSILQKNRQASSQVISHVHVHLIPRFYGDEFEISWPARRATLGELEALARSIKSEIGE